MPKYGLKTLNISICGGNIPIKMMNMIIICTSRQENQQSNARSIDVIEVAEPESEHVHLRIEQFAGR